MTIFEMKCVSHIGRVVRDQYMIAKNYLTSWFIIDLIAAVPYDRIFGDDELRASSGKLF